MNECGVVYRIVCRSTGRAYIGSARNLPVRWRAHLSLLRRGTHHSPRLQHAFDKYGEPEFVLEIIESACMDNLLIREQAWIDAGWPHLYNSSPTAQSRRGMKASVATRERQRQGLMGNQNRRGIPHSEAVKEKISRSLVAAYVDGRHKPTKPQSRNLAAYNEALKRGDILHPRKNANRDQAILILHARTKSLKKTGREFGITPAAVWCVVKRCNPSQLGKKRGPGGFRKITMENLHV